MPRDRSLPTVHEAQLRSNSPPSSSSQFSDPAAKSHRIPFIGYGGSPMMPFFQSHQGPRMPRPLVLVLMGIGAGALLTLLTVALMGGSARAAIDRDAASDQVAAGSKQYHHDIALPRVTREVRLAHRQLSCYNN